MADGRSMDAGATANRESGRGRDLAAIQLLKDLVNHAMELQLKRNVSILI